MLDTDSPRWLLHLTDGTTKVVAAATENEAAFGYVVSKVEPTVALTDEQAEAAELELAIFSGHDRQDSLNRAFADHGAECALDFIRDTATSGHRLYPQYAGKFDGEQWRLGRVRHTIRTKGGERFVAGDVVMFEAPFDGWDYAVARECTAYSVRGGIKVAVERAAIEAI